MLHRQGSTPLQRLQATPAAGPSLAARQSGTWRHSCVRSGCAIDDDPRVYRSRTREERAWEQRLQWVLAQLQLTLTPAHAALAHPRPPTTAGLCACRFQGACLSSSQCCRTGPSYGCARWLRGFTSRASSSMDANCSLISCAHTRAHSSRPCSRVSASVRARL